MILYPAKASDTSRQFFIDSHTPLLMTKLPDTIDRGSWLSSENATYRDARTFAVYDDFAVSQKRKSIDDLAGAMTSVLSVTASCYSFLGFPQQIVDITPVSLKGPASVKHIPDQVLSRFEKTAKNVSFDIFDETEIDFPPPYRDYFLAQAKVVAIESAEPLDINDDFWSI